MRKLESLIGSIGVITQATINIQPVIEVPPVAVAPAAIVVAHRQPGVIPGNVVGGGIVAARSIQGNHLAPQAPFIEDAIAIGIPSVVIVPSQRPIRSNRSEINRYVPPPPAKKNGKKRARTSLANIDPNQDDMSGSTEENEFE